MHTSKHLDTRKTGSSIAGSAASSRAQRWLQRGEDEQPPPPLPLLLHLHADERNHEEEGRGDGGEREVLGEWAGDEQGGAAEIERLLAGVARLHEEV